MPSGTATVANTSPKWNHEQEWLRELAVREDVVGYWADFV
jgi:hypothetical protein